MIQGLELFTHHVIVRNPGQFKAVFNEAGILFFPVRTEHRTMKSEGISYEDDGKGNALAVIIGTRRFEIRRHPGFAPDRVKGVRCFPITRSSRNQG